MKAPLLLCCLLLCCAAFTPVSGQTGQPSTEKIWKNLSRLPHTLRDDLSKAAWWQSTPGGDNAGVARLDSTVKSSSFNNSTTLFPLNKTEYVYPAPRQTVQSDFVNYGQWVLLKRTTITRDAQNRIVGVVEEEPDSESGALTPMTKLDFFWHGNSGTACDSVRSATWDEQSQQWTPAMRLYSIFDAKNQEIATETYRFEEGFQTIGIREEYEFDQRGDVTGTRQFAANNGQWTLLGKVHSTFDAQHHEISRQEDIAVDANRFTAARKLQRRFNEQGKVVLEERFKWNEAKTNWTPLKTIASGADAKHRSEWSVTESFTKAVGASYKTKSETFKRRDDDRTERAVSYSLQPKSEKWQVASETRYYYSR